MGDWPIIAVRFALYLTLGALFGLTAFGLYGLRASERHDALALRSWLVANAAIGLLLSVVALVLLASLMAGTPVWPIDRAAIGALLDQPGVGPTWKVRMVALALAGVAAMFGTARAHALRLVAVASGVALATPWRRPGDAPMDGARGNG